MTGERKLGGSKGGRAKRNGERKLGVNKKCEEQTGEGSKQNDKQA